MTVQPKGPRVVLITGASSGIGRATAMAFSQLGDQLVLASRSPAVLTAVAAECLAAGAGSARSIATDVCDAAAVQALCAAAVSEYGRVDVVVHCATVMAYGTIEEVPAAVFDRVVDTAIHGTAYLAQSIMPIFRRQNVGTFIVVNSLLGSIATPKMGAYVTAKWGQLGLIRVLQLEARHSPGISVCCVQPGAVNTPIYRQAANYAGRAPRPPVPVDPPEKVALRIVACADKPRKRISVGIANPLIVAGFRLMPALYDVLVTPLVNVTALSKKPATATTGNVFQPVPELEAQRGRWPRRPTRPLG